MLYQKNRLFTVCRNEEPSTTKFTLRRQSRVEGKKTSSSEEGGKEPEQSNGTTSQTRSGTVIFFQRSRHCRHNARGSLLKFHRSSVRVIRIGMENLRPPASLPRVRARHRSILSATSSCTTSDHRLVESSTNQRCRSPIGYQPQGLGPRVVVQDFCHPPYVLTYKLGFYTKQRFI